MELLGRPPPAYGLKFLTKAGSPEPVITRHGCPAADELVFAVTAGAAAATARMRRSAAVAPTSERVEERRICCPFSPVGPGRPLIPETVPELLPACYSGVKRTFTVRCLRGLRELPENASMGP